MKISILLIFIFLSSCSSVKSTYIEPMDEGEKIFAGVKTNINWIVNPPENNVHPYSTMGIIDFIPSAIADILFLPYTIYDKVQKK